MLGRIETLFGAICSTLLILQTTSYAQDVAVRAAAANDPAALTAAVDGSGAGDPEADGAGLVASGSEVENLPEGGAAETRGREMEAGETTGTDPDGAASEALALGKPNNVFSARPSEGDSDESASGLLKAVDPRGNEIARILGALGVVLGLLVVLRMVFRRFGGVLGSAGRPSGVIEIMARYPMGKGQVLLVLKMARRIILVHHCGTSMTTLSELTDPDEVASLLARLEAGSRPRDSLRFQSTLKSFEREHERLGKRGAAHAGVTSEGDGVEVVDLTKTQMKGLSSLLGGRRASA